MRYLKRYKIFENTNDVIKDCEDILLDISDDGHIVNIFEGVGVDGVTIEISALYGDYIRLNKYESVFEHLLSYLNELGYMMSRKSYCQNDRWEMTIACPECYSKNIVQKGSEKGFGAPDDDDSDDGDMICRDCKKVGYADEFESSYHPIDLGEFKMMIDQKYWAETLCLQFNRK